MPSRLSREICLDYENNIWSGGLSRALVKSSKQYEMRTRRRGWEGVTSWCEIYSRFWQPWLVFKPPRRFNSMICRWSWQILGNKRNRLVSLMTITKVTERLTHPRAADATHKSHLVDPVMSLFPHELTEQKVFPDSKNVFPVTTSANSICVTYNLIFHPPEARAPCEKQKEVSSQSLFIHKVIKYISRHWQLSHGERSGCGIEDDSKLERNFLTKDEYFMKTETL